MSSDTLDALLGLLDAEGPGPNPDPVDLHERGMAWLAVAEIQFAALLRRGAGTVAPPHALAFAQAYFAASQAAATGNLEAVEWHRFLRDPASKKEQR